MGWSPGEAESMVTGTAVESCVVSGLLVWHKFLVCTVGGFLFWMNV